MKLSSLTWKKKLSYGLLLFLAVLGLDATCIEPFRMVITEYKIQTKKWTEERPLKIVLLTDMHAIKPWMTVERLNKIVDQTNELNPDLVLLLGDYVATHPFGIQIQPDEGVAPYKNLRATCGVFAILGNHDTHKSVGWIAAMEKTGIPVMRNRAQKLDCQGNKFWLAGLDELWWGDADVPKTMAQVTDSDPVIMMMHEPDSFPDTPKSVALTVAGHTHGGQVRLPFIGAVPFVVPSQYRDRFAYGHIQEEGKDLVVSSGLGMTGLPVRFLCPPEITVISLSKEE